MKKILFVDDDKNFCDIMGTVLKADGFEVQVGNDGEEALRMVKSFRPDLILLDLIMPKMDGFEFLRQFRKIEDLPWIPVIVFSTQGGREQIEEAEKLGCQGYLVKTNIDAHALKDKINEFIGSKP